MDEMNIPSIILLALIVIALVLVIIHIIRNGGCSGDCSACKGCNNCSNCKKAEKAKSKTYTERQSRGSAFQTVDKPLYFLKMGSQGRSPRQGLGAVAPAK